MENIKKVLVHNNVSTSSSDDDSGSESLSAHQSKYCNKSGHYDARSKLSSKSMITKKKNGEKRLPTRKPDPNVYNRNALLARENRRKKKIYLETLERELDVVRKANRSLAKALRRQLNIGERLEKEKQYYENLVKTKFEMPIDNSTNFRILQSEENPISAVPPRENMFGEIIDVRSRSCSLPEEDQLSMVFDSLSDGSVIAPKEFSTSGFSSFDFSSFPEFSTDLYDSTDASLAFTSTTWDDIWGDKDYNIDNLISTNLTILQNSTDMQSSSVDHCYARDPTERKLEYSDQESEPSDYIDVEGIYSSIGTFCESCHICPTYHTPPTQLFDQQSSYNFIV